MAVPNAPVLDYGRLTRFLLPSLIGAFVFLFPVRDGDVFTIPMAVMSNRLTA